MRTLIVLAAMCASLPVQAAETGELVRFIACPVYRDADSGKKSGCWLADDPASGARFDTSLSPYKPDWDHAVLVEGRVSAEPPAPCGAAVLDPVRTSILADACPRHMLPAEGFPGRRFKLPPRNIKPLSAIRPVPPGPYGARSFALFFEFDRDFLVYQYDDYLLEQALDWIRAAKPAKLVVTGYAATRPEMVSGRQIAERPEVARTRAEVIAESLRRLLPGMTIETRWKTASAVIDHPDADGIPGQSQRRVTIEVVP